MAKRIIAADKPSVPSVRLVTEDRPDMFPSIVIDPPWRYDNVATRGAAEDHYPTMSHDDLCSLTVPAADDSHLYLWVTNGFIREGFDLVETERWDAPMTHLLDHDAVKRFCRTHLLPSEAADRVQAPVWITMRGCLVWARKP
jgi:hypothetical protein